MPSTHQPSAKGTLRDHGIGTKHDTVSTSTMSEQRSQFEKEAIVEEYKSVREEIIQRIDNQQTVTNYSLALIAVIIGINQLIARSATSIDPGPIYLLASLLFSAFALMLIEQDIMNSYLGSYIDSSLRPKIEELINTNSLPQRSVWQWEDWRKEFQYNRFPAVVLFSLIAASRYAMTIIPSFLAIVLYASQREHAGISIWENAFYYFCIVALVLVIVTAMFSGGRYVKRDVDQ